MTGMCLLLQRWRDCPNGPLPSHHLFPLIRHTGGFFLTPRCCHSSAFPSLSINGKLFDLSPDSFFFYLCELASLPPPLSIFWPPWCFQAEQGSARLPAQKDSVLSLPPGIFLFFFLWKRLLIITLLRIMSPDKLNWTPSFLLIQTFFCVFLTVASSRAHGLRLLLLRLLSSGSFLFI